MSKRNNTIDVPVFDGDDGIKYIRYNDMLKIIKKIKQKEDKEIERLQKIAHKMHLWIFLHSGDEQKVYDELGLTDEENAMLGYSGQFRIGGDDESE